MATKFKKGDAVQLKSGGPTMMVADVDSYSIHCQWFAGKKLDSGHFQPETLMLVELQNVKAEAKTDE